MACRNERADATIAWIDASLMQHNNHPPLIISSISPSSLKHVLANEGYISLLRQGVHYKSYYYISLPIKLNITVFVLEKGITPN